MGPFYQDERMLDHSPSLSDRGVSDDGAHYCEELLSGASGSRFSSISSLVRFLPL